MRVYRCIKLQEIINKYKNLEDRKKNNHLLNTHIYEKDKQYIHFFGYYDFAKNYYELGKAGKYDEENSQYVLFMIANIPNDILEKYKGFGFYEVNREEIPILEYAIPKEIFKPEYIVTMTEEPMEYDMRKNEKEEYKRYLNVIKELKQNNNDVRKIANYLLKCDFNDLLGMKIDTLSEIEIQEEIEKELSQFKFPKFEDEELIDLDDDER